MTPGDYSYASMAVVIPSDSSNGATTCLTVSIADDTSSDGNKTFTVTLTTVDPDVMLGNSITTVTITDDEGKQGWGGGNTD